jgi:hypothetical protein
MRIGGSGWIATGHAKFDDWRLRVSNGPSMASCTNSDQLTIPPAGDDSTRTVEIPFGYVRSTQIAAIRGPTRLDLYLTSELGSRPADMVWLPLTV